jgi:hypothetical protein
MAARVLHHPRVAWDATTVIVRFAARPDTDAFWWFIDRFGEVMGVSQRIAFTETVERLATSPLLHQVDLESARWRARITDALGAHPDLAEDVVLLTMAGRARLAEL